MKIDPKKATPEQIARGLELLAKQELRKERIKRGEIKGGAKWSEMTPEQKEKFRAAARRRNAKINLLARKAMEAGITVSDKEIDAYLGK